jgi:hypothetical protein
MVQPMGEASLDFSSLFKLVDLIFRMILDLQQN